MPGADRGILKRKGGCHPGGITRLPVQPQIRLGKRANMGRLFAIVVVLISLGIAATASSDETRNLPKVQSPLMKKSGKILLAHFMISFATPEKSGRWMGWNQMKTGDEPAPKPIIGCYDMTDPALVEYHCQLMKMAGIDGAVFDLGFFRDPTAANPRHALFAVRAMRAYARGLKKYGLKCMVVFEEKSHWIWNKQLRTRGQTVAAALNDLDQWLRLLGDVYITIGKRKVVGVFRYAYDTPDRGVASLSPKELARWKKGKKTKPILLSQAYHSGYRGIMNGFFEWPTICGKGRGSFARFNSLADEIRIWSDQTRATYFNLKYRQCDLVIGGVWPGFDDQPCQGWGLGSRKIPREDGRVYNYHWQRVIAADYPVVQIATWNDWFEGTTIEPSDAYGYQYLEMTRNLAGQWKKKRLPAADFHLAEKIYRMRRAGLAPGQLRQADQASRLLAAGDFEGARAVLGREAGTVMAEK